MLEKDQLRKNLSEALAFQDALEKYIQAHEDLLSAFDGLPGIVSRAPDPFPVEDSESRFRSPDPLDDASRGGAFREGQPAYEEFMRGWREALDAEAQALSPEAGLDELEAELDQLDELDQVKADLSKIDQNQTSSEASARDRGLPSLTPRQVFDQEQNRKPRDQRYLPLSPVKLAVIDAMRDFREYGPSELYRKINGFSRDEIRHAIAWLKNNDFVDHLGKANYRLRAEALDDARLVQRSTAQRGSRNVVRDAEIVKRYRQGLTTGQLAAQFKLSTARIYQILEAAGVVVGLPSPKGTGR